MPWITPQQIETASRTALLLYARVLAKIAKTNDAAFTPTDIGMTPRTVRTCVAELRAKGMAEFTKPRRADAPYTMILPTPSVETEAAEWMAGECGSNATRVYPTLSTNVYVGFREEYPKLGRKDFEERLKRAMQSAVLASVTPAGLMDWLTRGMQRPRPEAGSADPESSGNPQWDNAMDRAGEQSPDATLLE